MRIAFIVLTSLLFAVGCGRVESDPDASTGIDGAGSDGGGDTDAPTTDAPLGTDAPSVDAPSIDAAPPTAPFDLAVATRWTIGATTGVGAGSTGIIINKSTTGQTMDLNTLQVVSFTDDHPTINFSFSILNAATYTLPAQQGGGMMSTGAAGFVNPLVTETRFDTQRPTFDFVLNNIPQPIDVTVNASAVVRHGNQQATLTFVFAVRSTGSVAITGATRVSSVQM